MFGNGRFNDFSLPFLGFWAGLIFANLAAANDEIFRFHGIDLLHKRGLTGKGQVVGILEADGTHSPELLPENLRKQFTKESEFPRGLHDLNIVSLVTGTSASKSVAPESLVHYTYGGESFGRYLVSQNRIKRFEWKGIKDLKFTNEALENLVQVGPSVLLIPRSIALREPNELKALLLKHVKADGVIILALGNQGTPFERQKLQEIRDEGFVNNPDIIKKKKELVLDSLFYQWLSEKDQEEIFKSTLFIGSLDNAPAPKATPFSNRPGDFAPAQTVMIRGTQISSAFKLPTDNDQHHLHHLHDHCGHNDDTISGTSYSAAIAAGVFALLSEAYPGCPAKTLLRAVQDSASFEGLSHLPKVPNSWNYGLGKLDADRALVTAGQQGYCSL